MPDGPPTDPFFDDRSIAALFHLSASHSSMVTLVTLRGVERLQVSSRTTSRGTRRPFCLFPSRRNTSDAFPFFPSVSLCACTVTVSEATTVGDKGFPAKTQGRTGDRVFQIEVQFPFEVALRWLDLHEVGGRSGFGGTTVRSWLLSRLRFLLLRPELAVAPALSHCKPFLPRGFPAKVAERQSHVPNACTLQQALARRWRAMLGGRRVRIVAHVSDESGRRSRTSQEPSKGTPWHKGATAERPCFRDGALLLKVIVRPVATRRGENALIQNSWVMPVGAWWSLEIGGGLKTSVLV